MLEYLHLTNVGPAPEMRFEPGRRLSLVTGDNGLGKSFLLDVAWWALTRTWAGTQARPTTTKRATIEYVVHGKNGPTAAVKSKFRREDASWPVNVGRPAMPGIVIYIRIDGGFSVWDPARNYWRKDPDRAPAYHFSAAQVWEGLDLGDQRVCEGLERDWVSWQEARKPQFRALEEVMRVLSPSSETLRAGRPRRLFLGEGRDRPTLLIGNQEVPVALASAGVRRILALAYFLVWAWHEHRVAAELLNKKAEDRFVILFDEPETHLHPRWQRTIVPSVMAAIDALRGSSPEPPQIIVATHAPLVLASVEPRFSEDIDELFHLELHEGKIDLKTGGWATQGDVTDWLLSDVFGLEQARSVEAERAIEAAEALMRGDRHLPPGLATRPTIHRALRRLLPANDPFWLRWILDEGGADGPPSKAGRPTKKAPKKKQPRSS